MKKTPKLIIIRGPSGAGKSSVAKALKDQAKRPTVLISVDQIRNLFSDQARPGHQASKNMTLDNALFGLKREYDVILEGILNTKTHQSMVGGLFKIHPTENYIFYLEVSFEESLRRHNMRPERVDFGEREMKEWRDYTSPMGLSNEVMIPETSSLEESIKTIQKTAGI